MRKNIDRFAFFGIKLRNDFCTVRADCPIGQNIGLGHLFGFPVCHRQAIFSRQRHNFFDQMINRPLQIDRCRSGCNQFASDLVDKIILSVISYGQNHSPGSSDSDQGRPANLHGCNGFSYLPPITKRFLFKFKRKFRLIDNADSLSVIDGPNRASGNAVDFHKKTQK